MVGDPKGGWEWMRGVGFAVTGLGHRGGLINGYMLSRLYTSRRVNGSLIRMMDERKRDY